MRERGFYAAPAPFAEGLTRNRLDCGASKDNVLDRHRPAPLIRQGWDKGPNGCAPQFGVGGQRKEREQKG